jgi:plasmid stabilization system protein ParE
MRCRISRGAEQDLLEIFLDWAERASLPVADRIIERITARFRLVGEHPRAGKSAEEVARGVRCFPAARYLFYYRKARNAIEILHVFHSARSPAEIAGKMRRKPDSNG